MKATVCVFAPESSILGCSSSRYNLGDEDRGVISNVGVIGPSSDTEAEAWVTLRIDTDTQSVLKVKKALFLVLKDYCVP